MRSSALIISLTLPPAALARVLCRSLRCLNFSRDAWMDSAASLSRFASLYDWRHSLKNSSTMPESHAPFMRLRTPEALLLFLSIMAFSFASTSTRDFSTSRSCLSSATPLIQAAMAMDFTPASVWPQILVSTFLAFSTCPFVDLMSLPSSAKIAFCASSSALNSAIPSRQAATTMPMRALIDAACPEPRTPLTFSIRFFLYAIRACSAFPISCSNLSRMCFSLRRVT
mmetsp:Transcript_79471/g.208699  ORF Transcript_79471/g.208699 Transcript_79471/m.208699 type:complete len:227 (+) Transcript_79471:477-1157(+)